MREEIIGNARLILGDCREVLASLREGVAFDAVVTDPPYGIGWAYASYDDTFDNWRELVDAVIPWGRAHAKAMSVSVGPLEAEKHIFLNHDPKWRACWYRGSTGARSPIGFRDWETVFLWGDVPKPMHDFIAVAPEPERFGHSCPKPIGYATWLISRLTELGGHVIDPFMGSGTAGVAAHQIGRRFTGIEMDAGYFDTACKRIEAAQRQEDLFLATPTPEQTTMAL